MLLDMFILILQKTGFFNKTKSRILFVLKTMKMDLLHFGKELFYYELTWEWFVTISQRIC